MKFLALTTFALATSAFAGSALVNGDFEKELASWQVWGGVATSASHSGKFAVQVSSKSPTWAGVDQVIDIPAGTKKVKISGWIKGDSIQQGKEKWELGRIAIEFHDAKKDLAGGYPPVVGEIVGTKAWAKVERTYDIPTGAASIKLQCALGNTVGTVYCDDITLEYSK
ncbi:MAG: carbohydrate binding domain-containing protein [Fibrobacterota bacterium]|nr:carbohydrate binding domain-containing protein [Fibrobacterota bacterium]QQS07028.1 MAG: carbohydrate binding domain-containing protein [Fibrobacterota bacterium]